MVYRLFADFTLTLHFLFILFVIFGGLLVFKWKRILWLHIPCVIWGVLLEINQWICPLTYLENYFRKQAGQSGYGSGFMEYHLTPLIYPAGLTTDIQLALAAITITINLVVYGIIIRFKAWKIY